MCGNVCHWLLLPRDQYLDLGKTLDELKAEAAGYVDAGFKMLKVKIGLLSVEDDAKRVHAIRETVGDDVGIFVDCNHAYNAYTAVRMGKYLEKENVLFMEEPVIPEDREGYRCVREKLDIAIAGGEAEYTLYGFRDFITSRCIDIAQPDITVCGGLTEFLRIRDFATAYGVTVIPMHGALASPCLWHWLPCAPCRPSLTRLTGFHSRMNL